MEDCIFCKIVNGDIESEKIFESDNFIVIKDANPKTEGHSLVISKKHFVNLPDMPSSLYGEMLDTAEKVAMDFMKKGSEGFNLIMNNFEAARQVVKHAHMHIVPRKRDDNFELGV